MNDQDIATQALVKATEALTKIRDHERECATRWNQVRWLLGAVFAVLIKIALFPDVTP